MLSCRQMKWNGFRDFFTTKRGGRATKGYWEEIASSSVWHMSTEKQWQQNKAVVLKKQIFQPQASLQGKLCAANASSTGEFLCCSSSTLEEQLPGKAEAASKGRSCSTGGWQARRDLPCHTGGAGNAGREKREHVPQPMMAIIPGDNCHHL